MKKLKTIALVLIVLALSVSCLAISSFATGEVTAANVSDLLEYYTSVQMSEDYEDLEVGSYQSESIYFQPDPEKDSTLEIIEDNGEKAVAFKGGSMPVTEMYYAIGVDGDAEGFGFDVKVKINATGTNHPKIARGQIDIIVNDGFTRVPTNTTSTALLSMNPKSGELTVATATGDTVITDVTIEKATTYDISYYYNFETNKFSFTLKWDGGSYTSQLLDGAFESITGYKIGLFSTNALGASTETYFYELRTYTGSFAQSALPSTLSTVLDAHVASLVAAYNDTQTSAQDKENIAAVFADILAFHSYEAADPALNAQVVEIADSIKAVYAQNLISGTAAIDATKPYAQRVAYLESIRKFYDFFEGVSSVTGVDGAAFAAAKEAFGNEEAAIVDTAADSAELVALVEGTTVQTIQNSSYADLIDAYTAIKALNNVDPTYNSDVAAAKLIADALLEKVEAIEDKAEVLMAAIEVLEANAVKTGPLYAAYTTAFNNLDADETYPGVAAAVEAFGDYDAEDLLALVAICDKIIDSMNRAEMSNNYTARKTLVDGVAADVAELDPEEHDYPGLAEAFESFEAISQALLAETQSSGAYIEAVNAIKNLTSFDEIKAAVAAALALKETGAVEGVEGIKEANSYLSERETYVNCLEGYSKIFISLVNELKETTDIQTRLDLINDASAVKSSGYEGYTGFSAAATELEAQKTAYNAAVNAANSAFTSVVNSAVDAVTAPAPAILTKVVGIVKKMFE